MPVTMTKYTAGLRPASSCMRNPEGSRQRRQSPHRLVGEAWEEEPAGLTDLTPAPAHPLTLTDTDAASEAQLRLTQPWVLSPGLHTC